MIKGLGLTLLLFFSLTIYSGYSFAQDWAFIGHSEKNSDPSFYIFTLSNKGDKPGELIITQKHVFSIPQKLTDGRQYNSILMTRTLNCGDREISTDKAVFSNGIGSKVGAYENKNSIKLFEKIDNEREIDLFLLDKYCLDN